ncbi:MAG: hypothetical protein AB4352_09270 [Hormoscilla sp.]
MERIGQQIAALTIKVDLMSQALEQLQYKISQLLPDRSLPTVKPDIRRRSVVRYKYDDGSLRNETMDHKDVLVDDNYLQNNDIRADIELSSEIQIQRLTAQLTAAYNRIAALEEQLVSRRIH